MADSAWTEGPGPIPIPPFIRAYDASVDYSAVITIVRTMPFESTPANQRALIAPALQFRMTAHLSLNTGDLVQTAAHCFLLPYLYLFDPDERTSVACLVVDPGTGGAAGFAPAVGYVLGAPDTQQFTVDVMTMYLRTLDQERYPSPIQPPADPAIDRKRALLFRVHHPDILHNSVVNGESLFRKYPGHLLVHVLPARQGQGLGRRLVAAFLAEMEKRGCRGVHVGLDAENELGVRLWEERGFARFEGGPDSEEGSRDGERDNCGWIGRTVYLVKQLGGQV